MPTEADKKVVRRKVRARTQGGRQREGVKRQIDQALQKWRRQLRTLDKQHVMFVNMFKGFAHDAAGVEQIQEIQQELDAVFDQIFENFEDQLALENPHELIQELRDAVMIVQTQGLGGVDKNYYENTMLPPLEEELRGIQQQIEEQFREIATQTELADDDLARTMAEQLKEVELYIDGINEEQTSTWDAYIAAYKLLISRSRSIIKAYAAQRRRWRDESRAEARADEPPREDRPTLDGGAMNFGSGPPPPDQAPQVPNGDVVDMEIDVDGDGDVIMDGTEEHARQFTNQFVQQLNQQMTSQSNAHSLRGQSLHTRMSRDNFASRGGDPQLLSGSMPPQIGRRMKRIKKDKAIRRKKIPYDTVRQLQHEYIQQHNEQERDENTVIDSDNVLAARAMQDNERMGIPADSAVSLALHAGMTVNERDLETATNGDGAREARDTITNMTWENNKREVKRAEKKLEKVSKFLGPNGEMPDTLPRKTISNILHSLFSLAELRERPVITTDNLQWYFTTVDRMVELVEGNPDVMSYELQTYMGTIHELINLAITTAHDEGRERGDRNMSAPQPEEQVPQPSQPPKKEVFMEDDDTPPPVKRFDNSGLQTAALMGVEQNQFTNPAIAHATGAAFEKVNRGKQKRGTMKQKNAEEEQKDFVHSLTTSVGGGFPKRVRITDPSHGPIMAGMRRNVLEPTQDDQLEVGSDGVETIVKPKKQKKTTAQKLRARADEAINFFDTNTEDVVRFQENVKRVQRIMGNHPDLASNFAASLTEMVKAKGRGVFLADQRRQLQERGYDVRDDSTDPTVQQQLQQERDHHEYTKNIEHGAVMNVLNVVNGQKNVGVSRGLYKATMDNLRTVVGDKFNSLGGGKSPIEQYKTLFDGSAEENFVRMIPGEQDLFAAISNISSGEDANKNRRFVHSFSKAHVDATAGVANEMQSVPALRARIQKEHLENEQNALLTTDTPADGGASAGAGIGFLAMMKGDVFKNLTPAQQLAIRDNGTQLLRNKFYQTYGTSGGGQLGEKGINDIKPVDVEELNKQARGEAKSLRNQTRHLQTIGGNSAGEKVAQLLRNAPTALIPTKRAKSIYDIDTSKVNKNLKIEEIKERVEEGKATRLLLQTAKTELAAQQKQHIQDVERNPAALVGAVRQAMNNKFHREPTANEYIQHFTDILLTAEGLGREAGKQGVPIPMEAEQALHAMSNVTHLAQVAQQLQGQGPGKLSFTAEQTEQLNNLQNQAVQMKNVYQQQNSALIADLDTKLHENITHAEQVLEKKRLDRLNKKTGEALEASGLIPVGYLRNGTPSLASASAQGTGLGSGIGSGTPGRSFYGNNFAYGASRVPFQNPQQSSGGFAYPRRQLPSRAPLPAGAFRTAFRKANVNGPAAQSRMGKLSNIMTNATMGAFVNHNLSNNLNRFTFRR